MPKMSKMPKMPKKKTQRIQKTVDGIQNENSKTHNENTHIPSSFVLSAFRLPREMPLFLIFHWDVFVMNSRFCCLALALSSLLTNIQYLVSSTLVSSFDFQF